MFSASGYQTYLAPNLPLLGDVLKRASQSISFGGNTLWATRLYVNCFRIVWFHYIVGKFCSIFKLKMLEFFALFPKREDQGRLGGRNSALDCAPPRRSSFVGCVADILGMATNWGHKVLLGCWLVQVDLLDWDSAAAAYVGYRVENTERREIQLVYMSYCLNKNTPDVSTRSKKILS